MTIRFMRLKSFILFFFISLPLGATPPSDEAFLQLSSKATTPPGAFTEEKVLKSLDLTLLKLPNGMRILLKPMSGEEDLQVTLIADGGYTAFSPDQFAAAKYCGSLFFDAGFPFTDRKTFSSFLFRYNLEIALRLRPFQRYFDCTAPDSSMRELLATLHHLFLDTKQELPSLQQARRSFIEASQQRNLNSLSMFEDDYVFLNSGGHPFLAPTNTPQILSIDQSSLFSAYQQSFTNPAEYTAIFVGAFKVESLRPLLLHYLGSIPSTPASSHWPGPHVELIFPQESYHQSLSVDESEEKEQLIRLTFPIPTHLTQETSPLIDLTTQLMERRLRESLLATFGSTRAIDVQYYLPLFPRISPIWITLQYRCKGKDAGAMESFCLKELKALKEKGVSDLEFSQTKSQLQRVNAFWVNSSSYWLHTLANWTQWQWNLEGLNALTAASDALTLEVINPLLKEWCSFPSHTTMSLTLEEQEG
jgi:zinc protease